MEKMNGEERLKDWIHPMGYAKMIGKTMARVTQLLQEGKLRTMEHYGRRLIYIGDVPEEERGRGC